MHPGPINRGVEIESEVADGAQSVILNQVTYGIAVRMAVMSMAMAGQNAQRQHNQEAKHASLAAPARAPSTARPAPPPQAVSPVCAACRIPARCSTRQRLPS